MKTPAGLAIRKVSETSPRGVAWCLSAALHCRGTSTEGRSVGVRRCGFSQGGADASLGSVRGTEIMIPRGLSSAGREAGLSGSEAQWGWRIAGAGAPDRVSWKQGVMVIELAA